MRLETWKGYRVTNYSKENDFRVDQNKQNFLNPYTSEHKKFSQQLCSLQKKNCKKIKLINLANLITAKYAPSSIFQGLDEVQRNSREVLFFSSILSLYKTDEVLLLTKRDYPGVKMLLWFQSRTKFSAFYLFQKCVGQKEAGIQTV